MKQCMHCGQNYDGYDGDMMDCPHCGEYGGNSYVYGDDGNKHAFSWDTTSVDSSWSSSGSSSWSSSGSSSCGSSGDSPLEGCAAVFGIIFLLSIAGPLISFLWTVIKYAFIVLGCVLLVGGLITGTVLLWDYASDFFKNRSRSTEDPDNEDDFVDDLSAQTPADSFPPVETEQTAMSYPSDYDLFTITITDSNYFK